MTTTGLGLSAYIDVARYQRTPAGQEIASLLGLATTTNGATQPVGTTSLVVVSASGNASWVAGSAWILDGPTSEVVTVTGSPDGTHLTLAAPGTQFAHAAGVSVSQAGASGSLAETILDASAWIENYCQQGTSGGDRSLFALARTERWGMPTMRAHLDRDTVLRVMPGHFPVQSVSSVTIEFGQGQSLTLDATQAELDAAGRTVEIPYLTQGGISIGAQMFLDMQGVSSSRRQWAVVKGAGSVRAGIQTVTAALAPRGDGTRGLYVSPRCIHTISEFGAYAYAASLDGSDTPAKRDASEEPVKLNDHCLDALRYAPHSELAGIAKTEAYLAQMLALQKVQDQREGVIL